MTTDRTERIRRAGTVAGVGLLGSRRLITRAPGSAGPASLLLGAALVAVAFVVFLAGFGSERTTLGFGVEVLTERWGSSVEATDRQRLRLPLPHLEPGDDPASDLVFTQRWSDTLTLRGRADPETLALVELAVTGQPAADDPGLITAAMDLLVVASEPSLTPSERLALLQEVGVVEGGAAAFRATRGTTEYLFAVDATGTVGLSAAPR